MQAPKIFPDFYEMAVMIAEEEPEARAESARRQLLV